MELKVLVSIKSAPASKNCSMDLLNEIGLGNAQQIVASLQVVSMLQELRSAIPGLVQAIALDHRAHRAVDDDDTLAQEFFELAAVTHSVHSLQGSVTILGDIVARQGERPADS